MTIELSTVKYYTRAADCRRADKTLSHELEQRAFGRLVCCAVFWVVTTSSMVANRPTNTRRSSFAQPKRTRGMTADALSVLKRRSPKFRNDNQPLYLAHGGFRVLAGCGLLIGGALMMWRSPQARQAVFYACMLALCFHLSTALLKVYQFASMSDFFEATGAQTLRKAGMGGADRDRLLQHGLGSMAFGHALGVLFALALPSLLYARIMYFMTQPHVRETFAEDPYPEFREMEEEADAREAIEYAESLRAQLAPRAAPKTNDAAKFDRV